MLTHGESSQIKNKNPAKTLFINCFLVTDNGIFKNAAMIKMIIPASINLDEDKNNGGISVTAILFSK